MPQTQIVKWGSSLAVRIPKPIAEQTGLTESDRILIEAARDKSNFAQPTVSHLAGAGRTN
jgi:antitoxin component of MazEF toxin-antitoxin module